MVSKDVAQKQYEQERVKLNALFTNAANGDLSGFENCISASDTQIVCDFKDGNKRNVLHFAASKGHADMCELILSYLQDDENKEKAVNSQDINGDSPIRLAIRVGHLNVFKVLLKWLKTDLENQGEGKQKDENEEKATLLHEAASSGNLKVVELILKLCPQDINKRASVGTPLFWAAFNADREVAKILLEAGADVNIRDNEGRSPLLVAVMRNDENIIKILIEAGANLILSCTDETNVVGMDNTTILHSGAQVGAFRALDTILKYVSKDKVTELLKSKNLKGQTPAHLAAYYGHREVLELFENFGCEEHAKKSTEYISRLLSKGKEDRELEEKLAAEQLEKEQEECNQAKATGNEYFKKGDLKSIEQALTEYTKGVKTANKIYLKTQAEHKMLNSEASKKRLENATVLKAILLGNRSACNLKLASFTEEKKMIYLTNGKSDAEEATKLRPKWTKGFFRLGQIYSSLKQYPDAAQAFWTGYELEPEAPTSKTYFELFQKAVQAGKEVEQLKASSKNSKEPPLPASSHFKYNLPIEIPTDSSPNSPLRSLTLSFNDREEPMNVAQRFIQMNSLDPSLAPRLAHHVHEYLNNN